MYDPHHLLSSATLSLVDGDTTRSDDDGGIDDIVFNPDDDADPPPSPTDSPERDPDGPGELSR